jgi:ribosome maturation factor RimP
MVMENAKEAASTREKEASARIEAIVEPLLARLGFELVLLQYQRGKKHHILRLFVDKEGGVSLDDCADVSREVSTVLDVEDPIEGHYTLEVSSPGLNRPLVKERDFLKYVGQRARVVTAEPIVDRKTFVGRLGGVEDGAVIIDVDGRIFKIPHGEIVRANIEYQF